MAAEDWHDDFYDPPELEDDPRESNISICYDQLKNREKKPAMKINNKFYVSADRVITNAEQMTGKRFPGTWTHKTLAEAIKHAEELLEQDPACECKAIVQIIRVVRRKKAPVIVEMVK
jgi:hypothetical protein